MSLSEVGAGVGVRVGVESRKDLALVLQVSLRRRPILKPPCGLVLRALPEALVCKFHRHVNWHALEMIVFDGSSVPASIHTDFICASELIIRPFVSNYQIGCFRCCAQTS